jgi:hypothetical protein
VLRGMGEQSLNMPQEGDPSFCSRLRDPDSA